MGIMQCTYILSDFTDSLCDICCLLAVPEKHQVATSNAHIQIIHLYPCVADVWSAKTLLAFYF